MAELPEQRAMAQLAGHRVMTAWTAPLDTRGVAVLAHGKVDDLDHPSLKAVARGAAEAGWATFRFNFPYRQQGREAPDDFHVLCQVHEAACELAMARLPAEQRRLALGGKSQGSRTACALTGRLIVVAYLLLGYPLHPARGPRGLADAPLLALDAPCLLVQGQRDPLCRPGALQDVLVGMVAPHHLHTVPGGGHAFAVPGPPEAQQKVWDRMGSQVTGFLSNLGIPPKSH